VYEKSLVSMKSEFEDDERIKLKMRVRNKDFNKENKLSFFDNGRV
jgi:hypothetical protein